MSAESITAGSRSTTAAPNPAAVPRPVVRSTGRRTKEVLGLAWLHGVLHAAVFKKQVLSVSWQSTALVPGIPEFEVALDQAMEEMSFSGSDVFLVLEHDLFIHQSEQAPAFSEAAARAYLRGRIERYEKEHEPVLWVSQRTISARKEAAFLLHLLPTAFYGRLNSVLLARRLDLTRILPLVVPLQLMLETFSLPKDQPVVLAADTGETTTVLTARADGQLLFSRTMLARWSSDPSRLGVEVNRSLLYAKQQFGAVVDRIFLLGPAADQARAEVETRCGAGKEVIVRTSTTIEWLQAVARLSPHHPVNLVSGYIARKRRNSFIRRLVVGACWLVLGLLLLEAVSGVQSLREDRRQREVLQAGALGRATERDRLQQRNAASDRHREFVRQVSGDRIPPVPGRLLAFLSTLLPVEASLSDFSVKFDLDVGKWAFHLEGVLEGDEETARELFVSIQRQLTRSPFQVHVNENSRSFVSLPGAGGSAPSQHRFVLEGGLFEK